MHNMQFACRVGISDSSETSNLIQLPIKFGVGCASHLPETYGMCFLWILFEFRFYDLQQFSNWILVLILR